MGKGSTIEWTHHTFNPWWGCNKVSPACRSCYAEVFAHRLGHAIWGQHAPRRFFGEAHWNEPLRWNKEAGRAKVRARVFCASMADVFEGRGELDAPRQRLWSVIEATPNLDWLLLTKRPERIERSVPWTGAWPTNVWLGVTAENQHWANKRIPILAQFPARVRFVSCEPLLGPTDLSKWMGAPDQINWVIAGGESGHRARPMNPVWARSLRDQCRKAGVAFHFKQWGQWRPGFRSHLSKASSEIEVRGARGEPITLIRLGKKASGRDLDGRTWDQLPKLLEPSTRKARAHG